MSRGIDVFSAYQNVTNWHSVRAAGYEFAYIKVSDGVTTRDERGWGRAARAAGVASGGYHYAQFGDAIRQANLLVDRCEATGATALAPCLDLESPFTPNQAAINFAIAFLRQVRARGHRPCLYANNSMMNTLRGPVLAAVPETWLWVARYAGNNSTAILRPTGLWHVHQYSQAGHVPGISASSVDLNDGAIPFNSGGGAPAPPAPNLSIYYTEDSIMRVPAGGAENAPTNVSIPVCALREHDLVVAPRNKSVVIYNNYNWSIEPGKGTGGNQFSGKPYAVSTNQGGSWIVPRGTSKIDLWYWADDEFTVGVFPR